jgi:hypothetical protein
MRQLILSMRQEPSQTAHSLKAWVCQVVSREVVYESWFQ